jgi:hypothetical protein
MRRRFSACVLFLVIAACAIAVASIADASNGYLGVALTDLPAGFAGRGALVQTVAPNSPAQRAGFAAKDIVVAADGNAIGSAAQLRKYVGSKTPNEEISLNVMRWNGTRWAPQTIDVTLAAAPGAASSSAAAPDFPPPDALAPPSAPDAPPGASAAGASSMGSIKWVRFTDPAEQSFSVDVPAGWKTEGGLIRRGPLNIDTFLRSLAPDNLIYIQIGDPDIPPYAVPTRLGAQLGQREGQTYNPGHVSEMIMHYIPGEEYARRFGVLRFSKLCTEVKLTKSDNRPDIAEKERPAGSKARMDGGEAYFSCTRGHTPVTGYIRATTYLQQNNNIGIWGLQQIGGFIAVPDCFDQGMAMLDHMFETTTENPVWTARQAQITQATSNTIIQEHQAWSANNAQQYQALMGQLSHESQRYEAASHQMDSSFQGMDDAINGISHYVNPETGQHLDLDNTHAYQWSNGIGGTAGTNSDQPPPGGGWTKLEQVPQ